MITAEELQCGLCISGFPVSTHGYVCCTLPEGHEGPHYVTNDDGRSWWWEYDPDGDDPDDYIAWEDIDDE
jgi:hypothetical protein